MFTHRLVVARHQENVDWVKLFGTYTVYNKGKDNLSDEIRKNSVDLPNVGREAHSYIWHIVENYDKLEDIIIFSQGGPHFGYSPEEFFRRAINLGDLGFSTNLVNMNGRVGSNARSFVLNKHGGPLYSKESYNLGEWWEKTTGEAYVRSKSVYWTATFSVRKEFILKRSRESYLKILSTLDWNTSPMEAHFCERSWFNILNLPLNFVNEGECPQPNKQLNNPTLDLIDQSNDLMLKDENTVRKSISSSIRNIENWTKTNSPQYPIHKKIVKKEDLEIKQGWYTKLDESIEVSTTGSTTGNPFKYMRWMPAFEKIEWDYHYNFVLDEFEIPKNFHLLYFFSSHYKIDGEKMISCFGGPSELSMNNHGSSRNPVVHYANYNAYSNDPNEFFKYFFEYVEKNKIDVLFTAPPQINSMCSYIRKFKFQGKIANLLSSTNERTIQEDVYFLFENNHFDHICDHMRCWDGGGSFFTCKHKNYHLMDNLAWCEQGPNNEFICTDYFNLASPFVRYWNGDYCKIDNEYKRCECGRLYREFEFLENRPFSLKGVCFKEIKEKIKELGVEGIKQVRCSTETLDVISSKPLNDAEMQNISMLTDKFQFRFKVEAD